MIYIDTGPWLARCLARDQHHAAAAEGWELLASSGYRLLTSSFVIDEAITALARQAGGAFAAERARSWLQSPRLTILRPEQPDEFKALSYLERFADQQVSFTDCVSFALMSRHRIRRVFSFDRHFRLAGFETWPQDAAG